MLSRDSRYFSLLCGLFCFLVQFSTGESMSSVIIISRDGSAAVPAVLCQVLLSVLLLLSLLVPLTASARTIPFLTSPPLGESWFGIYFNDERTGFAHLEISEILDRLPD